MTVEVGQVWKAYDKYLDKWAYGVIDEIVGDLVMLKGIDSRKGMYNWRKYQLNIDNFRRGRIELVGDLELKRIKISRIE